MEKKIFKPITISNRKNIMSHLQLTPGALHHPLSIHREGESLHSKLGGESMNLDKINTTIIHSQYLIKK